MSRPNRQKTNKPHPLPKSQEAGARGCYWRSGNRSLRPKKILFVINTLGRAGAEIALLALLRRLDSPEYDLSLFVILGQGELAAELPPYVRLRNKGYSMRSVLSWQGRWRMAWTAAAALLRNGRLWGKLRDAAKTLTAMLKRGKVQPDKLLWRILSDGSPRFSEEFDLAVAYLEGAATYYVSDHVQAAHKCAFIHIDYGSAGYTREMDKGCWERFDRVFTVSSAVKEHFLALYPEHAKKTAVFPNLIDREAIRRRAQEPGGFADGWQGARILTVGRLVPQKAYEVAIGAMKRLKNRGYAARWYVLGEGDRRRALEKQIAALGLRGDFVLLGAVENPFPYYAQTDLYVHATRFEGKSIAIQEAQTLGCAIIASDCSGNREQVEDGVDGILCRLSPDAIADAIAALLRDADRRRALGAAAAKKGSGEEARELSALLEG